MPWTPAEAKQKKSDLTGAEAKTWAKIANSAYDRCVSDGGDDAKCAPKAIRIANSAVNKQRDSKMDREMLQQAGLGACLAAEPDPTFDDGENDDDACLSGP